MSPFEIYLRTGRRVASEPELETKFNPWHDPDDGRFTYAGQGRYFPGGASRQDSSNRIRGRGGSFGGGGASGSWEPNQPPASTTRDVAPTRDPNTTTGIIRTTGGSREQRVTIAKNDYNFSIDAHARPGQIYGELTLQSQSRSKRAQADAGKPDRRNTDDGGHFIAARFNGPREWFNHFAQDANFNRGAYRAIEDAWARAVRSGKRVFVDIVPRYRGTSMRPHSLIVTWTIDGKKSKRRFANERGGQ